MSGTHTYATYGAYHGRLVITDKDGGATAKAFTAAYFPPSTDTFRVAIDSDNDNPTAAPDQMPGRRPSTSPPLTPRRAKSSSPTTTAPPVSCRSTSCPT